MIKKAMIMAAGVGSRLHPLTQNVPKPLIPIANVPLMDLIMNHLQKNGIKDVIANTHYLAEQIQQRYVLENPTDISFNYIYEENLSGTAGGVKKCEFFFEPDDSFFVLSADGLCDLDFSKLYESHKQSGAIATMALYDVGEQDVSQFGVVVPREDGFVDQFQEKPQPEEAKSTLVNTGIYIFEPLIFKYIKENKFQDFAKDVFPYMLHQGVPINTFKVNCYWNDIGTISQYQKSVKDFISGKVKISMPNSAGRLIGNNIVKTPSFISPKANLLGNNSIGENCNIKEKALIHNCIIFDDVIIEENAVIQDCIVMGGVVERNTASFGEIIFQKNVNKTLI